MTVKDSSNIKEPPTQPEKPRILVVDDDQDIAHYLAAILTLDGHQTSEAYNAETAIELTKQREFDLVVTDLMMPGIGGLGLITYIRQEEKLAHLPVIMVTALHDNMSKASALDSGADDVFSKPVNRADLQARVRSLLRLKKANDVLTRKLEESKATLQSFSEHYLQLKQEREVLAQNNVIQIQRETTAKVAAAIWRELEQPLVGAINVAQTGLREGQMSHTAMEQLAEDLKAALRVTSKLEHLATEAIRNSRRANLTKPLPARPGISDPISKG